MTSATPSSACLSLTEPRACVGGEALACALAAAAQFRGDAEEARWLTALLLRHMALLLEQLGVLLRRWMDNAALPLVEPACAVAEAPVAAERASEPRLAREERRPAPGVGGRMAGRPRGAGAGPSRCGIDARDVASRCAGRIIGGRWPAGPCGLAVVDVGCGWLERSQDWVFLENRGLSATGFARRFCSVIV